MEFTRLEFGNGFRVYRTLLDRRVTDQATHKLYFEFPDESRLTVLAHPETEDIESANETMAMRLCNLLEDLTRCLDEKSPGLENLIGIMADYIQKTYNETQRRDFELYRPGELRRQLLLS